MRSVIEETTCRSSRHFTPDSVDRMVNRTLFFVTHTSQTEVFTVVKTAGAVMGVVPLFHPIYCALTPSTWT